jgi:hypothetical protein
LLACLVKAGDNIQNSSYEILKILESLKKGLITLYGTMLAAIALFHKYCQGLFRNVGSPEKA